MESMEFAIESKHQNDDAHSLVTMAPEILQRIFSNFNDETLLMASHVCTLFASLAKKAFKRKYARKKYIISPKTRVNCGFHRVILNRFGEGLEAVVIFKYNLISSDHCLMDSLTRNCHNIRKLELLSVSIDLAELFSHLPDLSYCSLNGGTIQNETWARHHMARLNHFEIGNVSGLKYDHLKEFFNNNKQIEILSVDVSGFDVLLVIHNRLKMLKKMKMRNYAWSTDLEAINLCSLESLELYGHVFTHELHLIKNGQNKLKNLTIVFMWNSPLRDSTLTAICSFNELTSLKILYAEIKVNQVKLIGQNLPNLASFHFHLDFGEELEDDIFAVLAMFPALTSLVIVLEISCSEKFNYDFHTRFQAVINRPDVQLNLLFREDELIVSNDKILKVSEKGKKIDPIIVHWSGYESQNSVSKFTWFHLNEKSLWSLFEHLDIVSLRILQKTCKEMKLKVHKYFKDTFERRAFNFIANEDAREWHNIFQTFGQYFQMINLEIPSTSYQERFLFGLINRYCTNLCELNLIHNGFFDIVEPNFSLPNLRTLKCKNQSENNIEISVFAHCPKLEYLELNGSITIKPQVLYNFKYFLKILFLSNFVCNIKFLTGFRSK